MFPLTSASMMLADLSPVSTNCGGGQGCDSFIPNTGERKDVLQAPFQGFFFLNLLMWKNHVKLNISHSMFLCNSEYVWRGNLSLRLCGAFGLKEPLSPISSVTLGILFDS